MEEEEMGGAGVTMRRRSMARSSLDNVLTVLRKYLGVRPDDYDIHVNFPGGVPVDGPSAGATMVTAIYSAITGIPVDNRVAMTGEVSIRGFVKPVGGIVAKIEAARLAGATRVIIPKDNWQATFAGLSAQGLEVLAAERIEEVIAAAILRPRTQQPETPAAGEVETLPEAVAAAAAGAPGLAVS
ncbi:MAG: hypothetical protein BAA04_10110 [Firmicutes bacterium ZCTH02-B6]|nr:MAG: hypothetical protein BAA04_10110 [Firmicutes bacterium ZCTH02-B6]